MNSVSFDPSTIVADINGALTAATTVLPSILPVIGAFYPPAAALVPFLPMLTTVLKDVQMMEQQFGLTTAQATTAVNNHMTPGAPNAPALGTGP